MDASGGLVGGDIGREILDEGFRRTCAEVLHGMLSLRSVDETWVCDDFDTFGFKGSIHLNRYCRRPLKPDDETRQQVFLGGSFEMRR